jgi:hypothetical protein
MNKKYLFYLLAATTVLLSIALLARAADDRPAAPPRYEYGMIKWDGPDKIQFITPEKTEQLRAFKSGAKLPPDTHDEEYCVTWAVNRMAAEGWEPVALHATRVMIRRQLR